MADVLTASLALNNALLAGNRCPVYSSRAMKFFSFIFPNWPTQTESVYWNVPYWIAGSLPIKTLRAASNCNVRAGWLGKKLQKSVSRECHLDSANTVVTGLPMNGDYNAVAEHANSFLASNAYAGKISGTSVCNVAIKQCKHILTVLPRLETWGFWLTM